MAVSIHNLIAAMVPDVYCKKEKRDEVKKLAKEKGYLEAAEKVEPVEYEYMDLDKETFAGSPFKLNGIKNPIEKHYIEYDNFTGQSLEPIYFWIIDYINKEYDSSEKLVDNFVSAVGSVHYTDIAVKLGQTQQNAQRMLELANTILKSILNLVYDLKDWRVRLSDYERYNSKNPTEKKASLLSLKERWLDLVDVRRGQGSIRALASQFDFVTLLNAFMAAETIEDAKKIDLNEIVKNVLLQRLYEFFKWIPESEKQLRTRYEVEKRYLKAQVDSLKLYSRWAKPYLKAAKQLEQRASSTASWVSVFETTILELTLLGKKKYNIEEDISSNNLPKSFRKLAKKNYNYIVVVELKFRASPQKTQYAGGYVFRGKTDIEFTGYALTEKELEVLKQEVEKDDLGDLMNLIAGSTTESLDLIHEDISEFLEESKKEEKDKKESEDTNPFSALFSIFKPKKKEEKEEGIPKDSAEEKAIRNQAILKARVECT